MTHSYRGTPNDDLLFAFIFAGWEKLMPLREAIELADYLGWHDPEKARRLGGSLVHGEPMPPDIAAWVAEVRNTHGQ